MKLHEITTLLRERAVRDSEGYEWVGSAGFSVGFSAKHYRQAAERVATALEYACQSVGKESTDEAHTLLHDWRNGTFGDLLSKETTDSAATIWNDDRRRWYAEDPDAPEWVDSVLSGGLTQPPTNETEILWVLGAAIHLQLKAANEAVIAWLAKTIEEAE